MTRAILVSLFLLIVAFTVRDAMAQGSPLMMMCRLAGMVMDVEKERGSTQVPLGYDHQGDAWAAWVRPDGKWTIGFMAESRKGEPVICMVMNGTSWRGVMPGKAADGL